MNWENSVVKLIIKSREIDYNHPLNVYNTNNYSGTGFFITNKLILTCYHVIKNAINIDILYKQTDNLVGTIKYIFPDDDLAIVEIDKELDDVKILELKVIDSRLLGEVYTVGFPLDSTNIKITKGIISGYQDSLIQTDASLNHGNSGGPLVIQEDNNYKVIGVNVSKLSGNVEKTGFVVPIYRFIILQKLLEKNIIPKIVIKKPILYFDIQMIIQDELRNDLFSSNTNKYKHFIENKIGVRISLMNPNYYYNNIKQNEIILSVNSNQVDHMGNVKFNFYPEKISITELGLWFVIGDELVFEIFNPDNKSIRQEKIKLKYAETNLKEYYSLQNYPNYYVENNGLILSIFSKIHLENIKQLDLDISQVIKILNRILQQNDLFTVYLADLDFTKKKKFIKYPIGEIIVEINDKKFNNYNEFITITKEQIKKIKTIDNDIFFV